jgi:predicted phage-related endonuclease
MLASLNATLSRLLLLLGLVTAPALPAADEKAPPPASTKPAAPAEVLELPKIQVTAQRIKSIDKDIKRLDKLIARESAKVKSSDLDRALNNDKLARAAAIFGGNSAEHLSAIAATRVALLENERDVLEAMKRPTTLAELAMMEREIEQLRETRRNLDDAAKQR